jgi:hypothetical protein
VALGALIVVILALLGCGGGMESIRSHPAPGDIEIDGIQTEWNEALSLREENGLWLGVMNDEESLYVTVITNNREYVQQIVTRGLTLWVDPTSHKDRALGLRFPSPGGSSGQLPAGSRGSSGADPALLEAMLGPLTSEFEIINPDRGTVRLAQVDVESVELEATYRNGTFVYEVKVPLQESEEIPFAVGASPGDTIAVGLTTPEVDRDAMREGRGSDSGAGRGGTGGSRGGMRGGRGGMGGGRGGTGGGRGGMGGGGGGTGGGRPSMPKPIDLWTEVVLSRGERVS